MSNYPAHLRVAQLVSLLSISQVGMAAAGPLASLDAEILPGVAEFVVSRSQVGRLSLAYCDQDCKTIY